MASTTGTSSWTIRNTGGNNRQAQAGSSFFAVPVNAPTWIEEGTAFTTPYLLGNYKTLSKPDTDTNAWNEAGATSAETFSDGGYIEFMAEQIGGRMIVGISTGPIGALSNSRTDHAVYLRPENQMRADAWESGSSQAVLVSDLDDKPTTNKFKIEFDGTSINYYYNGAVQFTSLTTYPSGTVFYVDVVFFTPGCKLLGLEVVQ